MEKNVCIRQEANVEQIMNCKEKVRVLGDSFDMLSGALSLAGNNVRLKILYLLFEEKELCVCDLSDILQMNVSAISQHLRKLKDRKIISAEKRGLTIFYALEEKYQSIFTPFFELIDDNKILER